MAKTLFSVLGKKKNLLCWRFVLFPFDSQVHCLLNAVLEAKMGQGIGGQDSVCQSLAPLSARPWTDCSSNALSAFFPLGIVSYHLPRTRDHGSSPETSLGQPVVAKSSFLELVIPLNPVAMSLFMSYSAQHRDSHELSTTYVPQLLLRRAPT